MTGPRASGAPGRRAWLARGFRPFFFLAGAEAALAVPAWVAVLFGVPVLPPGLDAFAWHAHEMVFGFGGALIAGFLLTAVSNWTGKSTLEGSALAGLAALWLGGRLLPLLPGTRGELGAAFDFAFWLGLLVGCARPILATKNARNYGFIALLAALLLACTASHAQRLGFRLPVAGRGPVLGVDLLTTAMLVVTGRVVPTFTRNATGAAGIASRPALDRAVVAAMALLILVDALGAPATLSGVWAALIGGLALLRARGWGARHTLGRPLLWSLHLGHAWVAAGLLLRGLAAFVPAIPPAAALHALTAGGVGLLALGMMTRVTLGHTGRMLAIPPIMAWAFGALLLTAPIRVLGPVLVADARPAHAAAALLWALAFATFLLVYTEALVSPRADGRPG